MPTNNWLLRELAQKLLKELGRQSKVDCLIARLQIPQLVAASAAGADADRLPEFAGLLQHFDQCSDCLNAYGRQSHPSNNTLAALADALRKGENIGDSYLMAVLEHCTICTQCAALLNLTKEVAEDTERGEADE